MLELQNITKVYPAGGENVEALRGVSLQFRQSEFVSILGPSGCGKTTLLNIVGGLDQYTSGDLLIRGRSTRDFSDRDWDAYRNHSIGFVFQSYNLIPHQSVLQNVELALTLSGVGKSERRRRAKEALEKVGLGDQMKKRPAEMSGGQMQRVAIARAIVNNPDIILADEPTGALDTETSTQVMDILKEIARDRLVIVVTHNPDLAQTYSTRIIRMVDGVITSDSAPLSREEAERLQADQEGGASRREKLPSMSLRTSFGLSLKNLFTKKGRTILTSFAGSIGIIGIALIYAVSNGMTTYINTVQEDTLSAYPLILQSQYVDSSALLTSFMGRARSATEHPDDGVYQKAMIYDMMNAFNSTEVQQNDLKAFKAHVDAVRSDENSASPFRTSVSTVKYTYDTQMQVYTKNPEGGVIISDIQQLMQKMIGDYMQTDMSLVTSLMEDSTMGMSGSSGAMRLWREMLPGENGALISPLFEKQYDLVYGSWPNSYDEVILIVDEDGELPDLTLYALGLIPQSQIERLMAAAFTHEIIEFDAKGWSYAELCSMDFRVVLSSDCYLRDPETGTYTDLRQTDAGMQYLYDNGLKLRVCGIVRPSPDAVSTMISGGIGYTTQLTRYIVERSAASEAVQAQLAAPDTDILTGLPFRSGNLSQAEKAQAFLDYVFSLDTAGKATAYKTIKSHPSEAVIQQAVAQQLAGISREEIEAMVIKAMSSQMGMDEDTIRGYLSARSDEELIGMIGQMMAQQSQAGYSQMVEERMAGIPDLQLALTLAAEAAVYSEEERAACYDLVVDFSDSTYEKNLKALGYVDLSAPSSISLYAATFADKDEVEAAIAEYNRGVPEEQRISYTDYVGLLMSSVTTIINAITYVLIAFVAISLIVSSIMIGVITLISVQERTKEIGILRSIGASKRNVSSMFNAETVLIGFASGSLGVIITYLMCIPINAILHHLTGLSNLSAILDLRVALILILISVLLTLIAGIIPSRSAAKKDPVVALRTE